MARRSPERSARGTAVSVSPGHNGAGGPFVPDRFDRITQNPDVLAGRAALRGLRISVAHVVNLVANGWTPAQVVEDVPDLEEEDVRQALAYAAALARSRRTTSHSRLTDAVSGGCWHFVQNRPPHAPGCLVARVDPH
jgi:uncharacterized protein (DUF433 family)